MKVLIITVAGTATRFNRDLKTPTLKCLYHTGSIGNTLLFNLCKQAVDYDKIIIVGGYLYSQLEQAIQRDFSSVQNRIELIYNPHFQDKGSMYSLYLGVKQASHYSCTEIAFIEGDLYFEKTFLKTFFDATQDIITINCEPIFSNTSVILYLTTDNKVKYLYDTTHHALCIPEPFQAIFNSAQAWKFIDPQKLFQLNNALSDEELNGTNLNLIQNYFSDLLWQENMVQVAKVWVNCNTVLNYNTILQYILKEAKHDETN